MQPPAPDALVAPRAPAARMRGAHWLVLAGLVAFFLFHATRYLHHIIDDSYIYYRFAENFARSDGLVFNPGEHVEGHSSTLWTVLLGLYGKLGLSIPAMARASGIALGAAVLLLSWRLALSFGTPPWQALAVPALLALSEPLAYWSASGMPEVLMAVLLLASALDYVRELEQPQRQPRSALWLVLAALTRPESFAIPVLFVGHSLVQGWLHDRLAAHRRQALQRALLCAAGIAALFAWRLAYYGWPLSNATYAKLGSDDGLLSPYSVSQYRASFTYLHSWFLSHWPLLVVSGAALVGLWPLRRAPLLWLALALIGFQLALILKSGGDWMPLWRFVLPAYPFLLVLTARGAARLGVALPTLALLLAGGVDLYLERLQNVQRLRVMNETWSSALETAQELRQVVPPGKLVASCAMGVVPYTLIDNPFLDMVGLCDEHIAHEGRRALPQLGAPDEYWEKADPDYVFEQRRPDYVLILRSLADASGEGGPENPERVTGSDGRVWSVSRTSGTNQLAAMHPSFQRDYELVQEYQIRPLPDSAGARASRRMFLYRRR